MQILWKTFYFDSAHFLPDYEGKCHDLHGHRWRADVGISGPTQLSGGDRGMIIDFSKLKEKVGFIFDLLDHTLLNEVIENPTAENIVEWLVKELVLLFGEPTCTSTLVGLRLYESPDSCIEWRR